MKALTDIQVDQFVEHGYVKFENAFPRQLADEGRTILWKDTGCQPDDSTTWTRPIIRLNDYPQDPFRQAVNTPQLHNAFDQLIGPGNWIPRMSIGTFPIRFPGPDDPGDTGWHVDSGFPGDNAYDFSTWRINVHSKGRALLMLFLFSDVGEHDAPTRIRVGSHVDVTRLLQPMGQNGLSFMELAGQLGVSSDREVIFATGNAGTVFLCHPFLVHAAQIHRGTSPRFMAQPALALKNALRLESADRNLSPLETSVRMAIAD